LGTCLLKRKPLPGLNGIPSIIPQGNTDAG
jgi:hypothetical protein